MGWNGRRFSVPRRYDMDRSVKPLRPGLPTGGQVRGAAAVDSAPHGVLRSSITGNRRCREGPQVPPTASKVVQDDSCCKILVPYRQVRRRGAFAWMSVPHAGALAIGGFDRHRGGGHPPTPATPPCVRVRTRRFELVTLASIDQGWKSERFEVSIGKPNRKGFGPSQVPRAASATRRIASQSRTNSQFQ
jgi:hypothetical protein